MVTSSDVSGSLTTNQLSLKNWLKKLRGGVNTVKWCDANECTWIFHFTWGFFL